MSFTQAEENYYLNLGLSPKPVNEILKLDLRGDISLNDFIFNTIDDNGVVWVITDIEGWWRPPSAEMPEVNRGLGDGTYDVQGRYNARLLTLNGVFLPPNRSLVQESRDRLVDAMDLVYQGAWLKTGIEEIRASWVRLSGDFSIQTVNSRGRTEFQIGLRAPDPIKYLWNATEPEGYQIEEILARNSTITGSGSGTIRNVGNYAVPCFLEVVGPVTSPATIYNRTTDKLIILTQSLKGRLAQRIASKELTFSVDSLRDIATLTTRQEHNFSVGDSVFVAGVGDEFDGDRQIVSIPTSTTFTFYGESADVSGISYKELISGVATLDTVRDYEFSVGDTIIVTGVDAALNGEHVVTATPSARSFSFSLNRVTQATIVSKVLVSNIATLTTSDPHQFVVGDEVTISGVDDNYDGTFEITAIPSPNQFSYAATRTNARDVTNRAMTDDIVTLTTSSNHGFIANEGVNITNVGLSFNGGFTITSTPTATTFTYRRQRATEKNIYIKSRTSNIATLATTTPHGFLVGEKVIVENVDGFNGTFTILSVPSTNTFTFSQTGSNLIGTAVQTGTVKSRSRKVVQRDLVANIATLVTEAAHGAFVGEQITVSGVGSPFDGTYTVLSIPSSNTLTYSKVASNVPPLGQGDPALTSAFVEMSGSVTSAAVSPTGLATVAGSLPFAGASGTATVPSDIQRRVAIGSVIKTNDVLFTGGLPNSATATLDADVLEIDTRNREVFFNGFVEGARGKIDVLADFMVLEPGDNLIEFEDQGSPDGQATLKVYYRSGWLS